MVQLDTFPMYPICYKCWVYIYTSSVPTKPFYLYGWKWYNIWSEDQVIFMDIGLCKNTGQVYWSKENITIKARAHSLYSKCIIIMCICLNGLKTLIHFWRFSKPVSSYTGKGETTFENKVWNENSFYIGFCINVVLQRDSRPTKQNRIFNINT